MGFVREDDGDGLLHVRSGVYAEVGHEVTRLVDCLEAFEGNIL